MPAPQTFTTQADGLPIHVTAQGSGPTLLLAHGIFGDSTDWGGVIADLVKDHRVVTVDLRGHGRSGIPTSDYAIADHAKDLLAAMDAAGVDHAVVVGHDIGGIAALHLALQHANRVDGLVLVNTTSEPEENALKWRVLGRLALQLGVRAQIVDQLAAMYFGKTSLQVKPKVVSAWKERVGAMDKAQVHRALRAWVRRPSIEKTLGTITAYTLTVAGAEDPAISPDNAKRVQEAIPGAKHKIVQSTGHFLPLEKPEAVAEWVRWAEDEMRDGPRDMRTGYRQKK
jgi:3-oxoadipate enol-lactonase